MLCARMATSDRRFAMTVKVLVVEDNAVARSFLCRVVRESFSDSMSIVESADLQTAREAIATADASDDGPFRLILVDLELPDGNGIELLSELVSSKALKIATTLYSDDDHLFPALQNGADGYLLKEDRYEVLIEELQRMARGQPPLSPSIARRVLNHFKQMAGSDSAFAPLSTMSAPQDLHSGDTKPSALDAKAVRLNSREFDVLTYLSKGFTTREIANLMSLKWATINQQISAIYQKLQSSSQTLAF